MNRHVLPTIALFFALTHCGSEAPPPPVGDAGAADGTVLTDAAPQPDAGTLVSPGADAAATPDGGCAAPLERCGDRCTDTSSDLYNCGGCDIRCSPAQDCAGGLCYVR